MRRKNSGLNRRKKISWGGEKTTRQRRDSLHARFRVRVSWQYFGNELV